MSHTGIPAAVIEAELERILASHAFAGADRPSRFLRFVVQQHLNGKSAEIKEYVVGLEVLGKKPDFDPRTDTIVRAEAGRLRARLDQYYASEGKDDSIKISVPKGSYVPQIDAFEDLQQQFPAVATKVFKGPKRGLLVAAAVAIAAGAGGAWLVLKPQVVWPPRAVAQVTFDGRLAMNPSISSDGKYVAYASDRAGQGNLDIWVQALPTGEPVQLTRGEANEDYPSFSPDGTKVAYLSRGNRRGIYALPVLGGEPRLLAQTEARPLYSPDGKYLLLSVLAPVPLNNTETVIIPAEGGEPRKLQVGLADRYILPIWSPDARHILALSGRSPVSPPTTWCVVPLFGGPPIISYEGPVDPGAGTPLAWLRDNRILISARSGDAVNLWQAKLSRANWKVFEPFERLTFGAGQITSASAANTGAVVFSSTIAPTRLWSFPLPKEGQRSEGDLLAFPSSGGLNYFPSLSDTGKMAYVSHKSGKWNVWIRDLLKGRETWLASVEGTNPYQVSTVIKPDGSRVAYSQCPGFLPCAVFTVPAAGGMTEKLCDACGMVRAWSSDGTAMASQEFVLEGGNVTRSRIERLDAVSGKKTVLAEKASAYLFAPDFSSDGRWVAFQENPRGTLRSVEQLFIAPLDAGLPVDPARWIAVTGLEHFDSGPKWSQDGKSLYFMSNRDGSNCLWAVRLDFATKRPTGEPFAVRHFHVSPRQYSDAVWPVFSLGFDRIVISLEQVQSDLWMMQLPER